MHIEKGYVMEPNLEVKVTIKIRLYIPLTTHGQTTRSMDQRLVEIAGVAEDRLRSYNGDQSLLLALCKDIEVRFGDWLLRGKNVTYEVGEEKVRSTLTVYPSLPLG